MIDTWWNCYNGGWGDELVPEAFAHPAKVSPELSWRIYDHAFEEGWLTYGALVLDCFGGVAGFALQAMAHGCEWIGVEIEQKFVDLGTQNIALWNSRYIRFPRWGSALLLQGDSRNLLAVVEAGRAEACVSSPPYTGDGVVTGGDTGNDGSKSAALRKTRGGRLGASVLNADYGHSDGQLGSMRPGNFAGAVGADGVVSSPPFEKQQTGGGLSLPDAVYAGDGHKFGNNHGYQNQGNSDGQLGVSSGDTFWAAARAIVQQTYAALRPGGHAIFVTKRFCRAGAIVDFSQQWAQLCQSCGFTLVHWHKAMLIAEAEQIRFDGSSKRKKRVSFFRRLHEKKRPDLAIDWEDVLCFAKECDAGERTGGNFDA